MCSDELANLGVDALAVAPSAKNAVVTSARGREVPPLKGRDARAERMRRLGLPAPRDVVEFPLDREERRAGDGRRLHQLAHYVHRPPRQLMLLEDSLDGLEVVLGR